MKRIISLIVVVLLMGQMSFVAFAHGGEKGHGHSGANAVQSLCNVAGCNNTEVHRHSGKYYYGHSMGDGHDYHTFCDVEGCTSTGVHRHNGAYYFEHTLEDGHDYHALCVVEDCELTDTHQHDGAYYYSSPSFFLAWAISTSSKW